MSLYNMMNGVTAATFYVLPVLGRHPDEYPRFRDCFVGDDERPETADKIIVFTRTGGGNREEYESENDGIAAMDGYLFDYDDDFDCTYANFVFDVPAQWADDVELVLAGKVTEVSDGYVDLVAATFPKVADKIRDTLRPAIATEARRAATEGAVHEGAGPQDIAQ